jgi:hypothetical protein
VGQINPAQRQQCHQPTLTHYRGLAHFQFVNDYKRLPAIDGAELGGWAGGK